MTWNIVVTRISANHAVYRLCFAKTTQLTVAMDRAALESKQNPTRRWIWYNQLEGEAKRSRLEWSRAVAVVELEYVVNDGFHEKSTGSIDPTLKAGTRNRPNCLHVHGLYTRFKTDSHFVGLVKQYANADERNALHNPLGRILLARVLQSLIKQGKLGMCDWIKLSPCANSHTKMKDDDVKLTQYYLSWGLRLLDERIAKLKMVMTIDDMTPYSVLEKAMDQCGYSVGCPLEMLKFTFFASV